MACRNFFSGVEGKQHYEACVQAGAKHVLTSYLQFFQKGDLDFVKRRKLANPEINIMVDSGAHTFLTDWQKYSTWTRKQFDAYAEGYAKWLYDNRKYLFAAVELDIDYCLNMVLGGGAVHSTFGTNIVEQWQKNLFIPLEAKGLPICFVWHTQRRLEGWEEMCSKFSYVGLPGTMSSDADFNKYITVARRYATKIHGFAATKQADFRDWPWFSIDSITWKTSEMYGTLIHWDGHNQKLVYEEDKSARAQYRSYFLKHGLDADGIIKDTAYKEVTKYALISMRAMEAFYEKKFAARTFYYEMRLPMPPVCIKGMESKEVWSAWLKFRPEILFKADAEEKSEFKVRQFLAAISCVQNRMDSLINSTPAYREFLERHFARMMLPAMADPVVFQKEMAVYLTPPNPPALQRVDVEHYLASNNPPKRRPDPAYEMSDLEVDPANELPIPFGQI